MRRKKQYTRILISLLVMSLMLSSVSISSVTVAAESGSTLDEMQNEVASQLSPVQEAKLDALAPNNAGDWWQARQDNLPWNYFHNAVQRHIRDNNNNMGRGELSVQYTTEDKKTHKKTTYNGRADLYRKKNDTTYIWEVKPASYQYEPRKSLGLAQLKNYVESKVSYEYGNQAVPDIEDNQFEYGNYRIEYVNMKNGLILYRFERKPQESTPPSPGIIGKPKEDAEKDVKDKLTDFPTAPENNQVPEDIAAIVKKATVCAAIATGTIAVHGRIRNTNSVSRTLVTASEGLLVCLVPFLGNPTAVQAAEAKSRMDDYMDLITAVYGEDAEEAYEDAIEEGDKEKAEEITEDIQNNSDSYDEAANAQPPRDPLVVDLGAEGIDLKPLQNGVNFDLDNNGFAEKTAWIGEEDGFLAYDRNGNGRIENGGELFGDQVMMKNGRKSKSGFEALGELDDNQDGVISTEDRIFCKLTIWIDGNHNGQTEEKELTSLSARGIRAISLDYKKISLVDEETGTRKADTAEVLINEKGKNTTTSISEFWFPVNTVRTTDEGAVTVGNVPNIDKAIKRDKSGELAACCNQFIASESPTSKRYYLKKVLYCLTGAENVPKNSRGGNIDARELKVVEQFMGQDFIGVGGSNPNGKAAEILKSIYEKIENQYYCKLNLKGAFGGYLHTVLEQKDDKNHKTLDLSCLYYVLDGKISRGDYVEQLLYDFGVYFRCFDEANGTDSYQEFLSHYQELDNEFSAIIRQANNGTTYLGTADKDSYRGTSGNDFLYGLEADDTLYGFDGQDTICGNAGNDYLYGEKEADCLYGGEGDDYLYGGEGKDTLCGDAGNDVLNGGAGDDQYLYHRGDGNDRIWDRDDTIGNVDTLSFGVGIRPEDIIVKRTGCDLELRISGTDINANINKYRKSNINMYKN